MKFTRQQTIFWTLIIGAGITLISLFVMMVIQVPGLQSTRQSIDNTRVSARVLTDQQSNLVSLASQLKELEGEQERLSQEIWKFTDEEAFFSRWDSFGQANNVVVEVPSVADVVPSQDPVARSAELLIEGSMTTVLKAIDAIQVMQPLVAIQTVTLQPSDGSGKVQALITVETIWQ